MILGKITNILTASLALTALTATAQTNEAPAESESGEGEVDVSMRIYKWAFSNSICLPDFSTGVIAYTKNEDDGDMQLWYKTGKDSWGSIKAVGGELSHAFTYKGSSTAVFYTRVNSPGKEDYTYRESCRLQVPTGMSEIFVLMIKKGSSIKLYPMNISPENLPKDKIAVMNMTSQNIALSIGGHQQALRGGAYTIFAPKKAKKDSVDVKIARYDNGKNKWIAVYSNIISIPNAEKRSLILIYDPANQATPRFSVQMLTL